MSTAGDGTFPGAIGIVSDDDYENFFFIESII